MIESKFFVKKLTSAEVGQAKTHEYYIRLSNDFDYDSFFEKKCVTIENVIQFDFVAKDLSVDNNLGYISLKFVYYFQSNNEKRIPSLRKLFADKKVKEGDVICLESRNVDGQYSYYITFTDGNKTSLSDNSLYYSLMQDFPHKEKITVNPLQRIYYGAPGTGKSNEIKKQTVGKSVIRTTFHPDSDYSTFVGAYKPTTLEKPVTTAIGTKLVQVEDSKGNHISETIITYDYVPQAFLQAYIKAWKFMSNTNEDGKIEEQFLVIEEINRGNCAQIFGDLFQLLDRNNNGFSEYPINADKDIEKHIKKAFDEEDIKINASISSEFEEYEGDIASDIQNGKVLVLPQNLYIWATMNTSDQSLFPMDSAFKRRWDWKYMPINVRKESWAIEVQGVKYSWSSFLEKINDEIGDTTSSEDKKLGFYFCKAKDNVISSEKFVSKVLFYIYNDVFKDYEFCRDFFRDEDGKIINFQKFFIADGSINEVAVKKFLDNLKVKIL